MSLKLEIINVSLKERPPPSISRIEALNVMMPMPPISTISRIIVCPKRVKFSIGSTLKPLTQTAEVAMKSASLQASSPAR